MDDGTDVQTDRYRGLQDGHADRQVRIENIIYGPTPRGTVQPVQSDTYTDRQMYNQTFTDRPIYCLCVEQKYYRQTVKSRYVQTQIRTYRQT